MHHQSQQSCALRSDSATSPTALTAEPARVTPWTVWMRCPAWWWRCNDVGCDQLDRKKPFAVCPRSPEPTAILLPHAFPLLAALAPYSNTTTPDSLLLAHRTVHRQQRSSSFCWPSVSPFSRRRRRTYIRNALNHALSTFFFFYQTKANLILHLMPRLPYWYYLQSTCIRILGGGVA